MAVELKKTKKVVRALVAFGSGRIVYAIIRNNVHEEENKKIDKITVPVTSYMMGGLVADAVGDYSDRYIDELANTFSKIRSEINANEDTK